MSDWDTDSDADAFVSGGSSATAGVPSSSAALSIDRIMDILAFLTVYLGKLTYFDP
jgi:hypothetical protein